MIRQDDKRIKNKFINSEGCAYFSVLYFVNKFTNLSLNPAKIEIYLDQMVEKGCFTDNMDIIWTKAFAFFDIKVKYTFKDDPKYKLKKGEFSIAKFHNERTGYNHFVPCENGVVLFDPIGTSVTVAEGSVESYRVFKIIK